MDKILNGIMHNKLYISIAIIILGLIIYEVVKRTINRIIEKDDKRIDKKGKTVFKLFSNIVKYIVIIIVTVLILQLHGVNVNSIVAGLGIISVIAGLAIQDPIKDIISGMNIVSDEYFALGDVVKIDEIEGKVIEIGVRTTKIKDVLNDNIYTIANRNISKALKISNQLYLSVPISYEDDTEKIDKILIKATERMLNIETVKETKYLGVTSFEDSYIDYKIKIICAPDNKIVVKRIANSIIKNELDKNGISIPFPQLTIHQG